MQVILVGKGEVIFFLTRAFISKGYQVSVITPSRKEAEQLEKAFKAVVIKGDGTDPETFKRTNPDEAEILISALRQDNENLSCCQYGQKVHKIKHTLAVINDPENEELFRKLGINYVFNQTNLIVSLLERYFESEYVIPVFSYSADKLFMYEFSLASFMPAVGKTPGDLDLPRESVISGVIRDDVFLMPSSDFSFSQGDKLLVSVVPEALDLTIQKLCGSSVRFDR